jgi:hypothetical protein
MPIISKFWFGDIQTFDEYVLNEEINKLPPLKELTPKQLKGIGYDLAFWNATDAWTSVKNEWIDAVVPKLKDCDLLELSGMVWSLAVLSVSKPLPEKAHEILSYAFSQNFLEKAKLEAPNDIRLNTYRMAYLRFVPGGAKNYKPVHNENTIPGASGNFVDRFADRLALAGAVFEKSKYIPELDTCIDFAVKTTDPETGKDKTVFIQYDGWRRFFKDSCWESRPNGRQHLESALLRQFYEDRPLIRVPYWINAKMSAADIVGNFVDGLPAVPPGAYTLLEKKQGFKAKQGFKLEQIPIAKRHRATTGPRLSPSVPKISNGSGSRYRGNNL